MMLSKETLCQCKGEMYERNFENGVPYKEDVELVLGVIEAHDVQTEGEDVDKHLKETLCVLAILDVNEAA